MTTLKLYQTHLTLGRNAKVDDIESYLATLQSDVMNIQYQRIGTDIVINVPYNQKLVGEAQWNYASITQDRKIYYFFIIGAEWKARKSVALTLSMDTVNTWWDELQWSSKTSIVREHRDRFIKGSNQGTDRYVRRIDIFNEGLEPVATTEARNETFIGRSDVGKESAWYLIYKTRSNITPEDTVNPISVMFVCDEAIELQPELNNIYQRFPAKDWGTGTRFITETGNADPALVIETPAGDVWTLNFPVNADGSKIRAYRIVQSVTSYKIYGLSYTGDSYPYAFKKEELVRQVNKVIDDWFIELHNIAVVQNVNENVDFYKTLTSLDAIDGLPNDIYNSGRIPARSTVAFNDLDRSNSKFVKIIQIPYPPTAIVYDDFIGGYQPRGNWTYNVGYQAIESTLNNQEFVSLTDDINLDDIVIKTIEKPTGEEGMIFTNESKIFNSEFYKMSMMYGDVSLPIKPERFVLPRTASSSPTIRAEFSISNALNTTMAFKAEYGRMDYRPEYYKDGYLFSTVSTEKPIFNSSYVDYLRTGYNYDKEALNQQNRMAAVQGALGIAGGLVSVAGAGASLGSSFIQQRGMIQHLRNKIDWHDEELNKYSYLVDTHGRIPFNQDEKSDDFKRFQKLLAARNQASVQLKGTPRAGSIGISFATQLISGGINAISSAISTFKSIESNNRSFASGMAAKQAQGVNALGVSDIDIQTQATGKGLKLIAYWPENYIQREIIKTFHYTGYSHPIQTIPDFTSRYWFNFVQCEPVFKDEEVSIYSNYLDDIKARFSAGITVYHNHNGVIDWEQEKENWEQWFITEA